MGWRQGRQGNENGISVSPRHSEPVRFDTHGDMISPAYILKTKREGHWLVNVLIGEVPPVNIDEVLK